MAVLLLTTTRQERRQPTVTPMQAEKNPLPVAHLPHKSTSSSCCEIASRHRLNELCPTAADKNASVMGDNSGSANCSCVDFMRCKLVVVTALSQNHFKESVDFFGSVHAELPEAKVIVYDLGLSAGQFDAVQSYCNVMEVRKFKFDQYPGHTRNLWSYAWKPFVIEEISRDHELFLYCDASCQITDKLIPFLPNILKFPIISLFKPRKAVVIRYTHQGTLDYFKVSRPRSELMKMLPEDFLAGVILVWVNDLFRERILRPWVDCAEHVDCIAPQGATLIGCNRHTEFSIARGCHRYDQSALNVILLKEFGESLNTIFNENDGIPITTVVSIERFQSHTYDNPRSHKCNIRYF